MPDLFNPRHMAQAAVDRINAKSDYSIGFEAERQYDIETAIEDLSELKVLCTTTGKESPVNARGSRGVSHLITVAIMQPVAKGTDVAAVDPLVDLTREIEKQLLDLPGGLLEVGGQKIKPSSVSYDGGTYRQEELRAGNYLSIFTIEYVKP